MLLRTSSFLHSLAARLQSFYEELHASAPQGTTVLVSHGGAMSALMHSVLLPLGHVVAAPGLVASRFWNCSITEIDLDARPPTVVRWADTAHLASTEPQVANVDEA